MNHIDHFYPLKFSSSDSFPRENILLASKENSQSWTSVILKKLSGFFCVHNHSNLHCASCFCFVLSLWKLAGQDARILVDWIPGTSVTYFKSVTTQPLKIPFCLYLWMSFLVGSLYQLYCKIFATLDLICFSGHKMKQSFIMI